MIIKAKDGSVMAAGRVTKKGSGIEMIGKDMSTPKYSFSIGVKNTRDANGEWHNEYLECAVIGKDADKQPVLMGGDRVHVDGTLSVREWTGKDGIPKKSETCLCDYIGVQSHNSHTDTPTFKPAEVEDDSDLPF